MNSEARAKLRRKLHAARKQAEQVKFGCHSMILELYNCEDTFRLKKITAVTSMVVDIEEILDKLLMNLNN